VLAEAQETLAQASGTISVIRPQALGLIAAAKVTAGETAQAARRIDGALPQFLITWDRLGTHSAGIAQDAHTFTSKFVAPRTFRQKFWDGIKTGAYVAGRVLP